MFTANILLFIKHLFIDLVSLHFDNKYITNMKLDLFCACRCKIIGVDVEQLFLQGALTLFTG